MLATGIEPAMHRKYRIAVVDDDPAVRETLRTQLTAAGHNVVVEASSGMELTEWLSTNAAESAELFIIDADMEGTNGIVAAKTVLTDRSFPVIIVSEFEDSQLIELAVANRASAFLLKPIRTAELHAAIQMAIQRFEELQKCHLETASAVQALEDRKIIERAKGVLMRERALDEPAAFSYLQQLARQHRQKIVDVAKSINLADHALNSH